MLRCCKRYQSGRSSYPGVDVTTKESDTFQDFRIRREHETGQHTMTRRTDRTPDRQELTPESGIVEKLLTQCPEPLGAFIAADMRIHTGKSGCGAFGICRVCNIAVLTIDAGLAFKPC